MSTIILVLRVLEDLMLTLSFIGKVFVYKHCFCFLNVQNVKIIICFTSSLVGILITVGDITDIFAMRL